MRVSVMALMLSASLLRAGETCGLSKIEDNQLNYRIVLVDADGSTFKLDDAGTGPRLFRFDQDGNTGWLHYYNSGIRPSRWAANREPGGPLRMWYLGSPAAKPSEAYLIQTAADAITGDSLGTDTLAFYPDASIGGNFIRMRDGGVVACLSNLFWQSGTVPILSAMRQDAKGKTVWNVSLVAAATAYTGKISFQVSGGREMEDGRILVAVAVMEGSTQASSMLLFLMDPASGKAEILGDVPEIPCFIARNTKDTQYMTYGLLPFLINVKRPDGTTSPWLAKVWVEQQATTGVRQGRVSRGAGAGNGPGMAGRAFTSGGRLGFGFGGRDGAEGIYTADGCRTER
jgi:hypothetical protein